MITVGIWWGFFVVVFGLGFFWCLLWFFVFCFSVNTDYTARDYINALFLKVSMTVTLEAPVLTTWYLRKDAQICRTGLYSGNINYMINNFIIDSDFFF